MHEELEIDICSKCKCVIDTDYCWCGIKKENHSDDNHFFIPCGCTCYFAGHEIESSSMAKRVYSQMKGD